MRWGSFFRRLKTASTREDVYQIGDVEIVLTSNHPLPNYQAEHRLYDRLPLILGLEDFDGWIIDVGANVGDSAAAFVSGPPKKILCIEPYPDYVAVLKCNKTALEANGSQIQIAPYAASRHALNVQLAADSGTARATFEGNAESLPALTLDDIIMRYCADQTIDLIKCDVDGLDADVLLSGMETIQRHKPIIYFECDIISDQIDEFVELYRKLSQIGYKFVLYDNFGLPMQGVRDLRDFQDTLEYICKFRNSKSQRTLFYVDCLAFNSESQQASNIISNYASLVFNAK